MACRELANNQDALNNLNLQAKANECWNGDIFAAKPVSSWYDEECQRVSQHESSTVLARGDSFETSRNGAEMHASSSNADDDSVVQRYFARDPHCEIVGQALRSRLATKLKLLSSKIEAAQSSSTIEQFCQDFKPSAAQCFENDHVAAAAAHKKCSDGGHVAFVQQTLLRCLEDGHVEAAQSFAKIHWRNPPVEESSTVALWSEPCTGASQETGPARSLSRIQWRRIESPEPGKTLTIGCGLDDERPVVTQVALPATSQRQRVQSMRTECVLVTQRMDGGQAPPKRKLSANGAVCLTGLTGGLHRRANATRRSFGSKNSCSSATSHRTRVKTRNCAGSGCMMTQGMMTQDLEVNIYLVFVALGLVIPFLSVAFGLMVFVMLADTERGAMDAFTSLGDVLFA